MQSHSSRPAEINKCNPLWGGYSEHAPPQTTYSQKWIASSAPLLASPSLQVCTLIDSCPFLSPVCFLVSLGYPNSLWRCKQKSQTWHRHLPSNLQLLEPPKYQNEIRGPQLKICWWGKCNSRQRKYRKEERQQQHFKGSLKLELQELGSAHTLEPQRYSISSLAI